MTEIHVMLGHASRDRTLAELNKVFFWNRMASDLGKFISQCTECCLSNPNTKPIGGPLIQPAKTTHRGERIGIDFMQMPTSRNKNKYVILAVDHHTGYVEAKATKNEDANTVVDFLIENWILRHGSPEAIVSDRGAAFMSQVVKAICDWTRTNQIFTSGYNPQSNGATEVRNKAIQLILRKISDDDGDRWDEKLSTALWIYNTTQSSTTKLSPFEMTYIDETRRMLH